MFPCQTGGSSGAGSGRGSPVEAVAQDRLHRAVGARRRCRAALAGRLDASRRRSCAPGAGCRGRRGNPARDAAWRSAGSSTKRGGGGPIAAASCSNRVGVRSAWRRCALGMCSGVVVCPGAPRTPQVAGHPAATMEQLDGLLGDAGLDHLARQAIGHGVEVPLHLDVVVEPGAAATPLGVGVGFGRQRQQGGPLQALRTAPDGWCRDGASAGH